MTSKIAHTELDRSFQTGSPKKLIGDGRQRRPSLGCSTSTATTACSYDGESQRSTGLQRSSVQIEEPLKSCMKVRTIEESLRSQKQKPPRTKSLPPSWRDNVQHSMARMKESSSRFLNMSSEVDSGGPLDNRMATLRKVKSCSHVLSSSGPDPRTQEGIEPDSPSGTALSSEEEDKGSTSSLPAMPQPSRSCRREGLAKMKSLNHVSMSLRKMNSGSRVKGSMTSMRNLLGSRRKLNMTSMRNLFRRNSMEDIEDDTPEGDDGVKFGDIEIREYRSVVCDNPGVSRGPAVTLGWAYDTAVNCTLDHYEFARAPRKQMRELALSRAEREARLIASGVTRYELERAVKSINLAKQKRTRTVQRLEKSFLDERLEGAKRKFKKIIRMRKSYEKEEEDLWANAQAYFSQ